MESDTGILRKIVFTGNFLRFPGGHFATHILHRLLSDTVEAAIGTRPSFFCPGILDANYNRYMQELEALGIPGEEAWVYFQEETADLPESIQASLRRLNGLVVGFEIPPSMCRWFSDKNIPYLNFFIHPVRFLPDLLLAIATNDASMGRRLNKWTVNPIDAFEQAGVIKALCTGDVKNLDFIQPGAAVFFGQTLGDSSVVTKHKITGAMDYLSELREIASRHSEVIIAPHPYEKFSATVQLMRGLGRGTIVNCNSYSLLSHENIDSVITLSSSIGIEAKFFNKNTMLLLGDPLRPGGSLVASDASLFAVGHPVLSRTFWMDVLGLAAPDKHPSQPVANGFKAPNLLRSLFGGWAYDQLDPILLRKAAMAPTFIGSQSWKRIEYRQVEKTEDQVIYLHPKKLKINFKSSGNGLLFATAGFSQPEEDGTWTDAGCAEIIIPAENINACTAVSFRVRPFVNDLIPQQKVMLSVNSIPWEGFCLKAGGEYQIKFVLPLSEPPVEYYSIKLELPDARSPRDLNLSQDNRKLAIKLIEVELIQEPSRAGGIKITQCEPNGGEEKNTGR